MSFPVAPTQTSTPRTDLHNAISALVGSFITTTSYAIVRKFWHEMPQSLTGEGPMVVLGELDEEIQHDQGLRRTRWSGSLWYVDWITDPQEYSDRVNLFADRMRDWFTANPLVALTGGGSGLLEQVAFSDGTELVQGTIRMGAPQLRFTFMVQEGRDRTS